MGEELGLEIVCVLVSVCVSECVCVRLTLLEEEEEEEKVLLLSLCVCVLCARPQQTWMAAPTAAPSSGFTSTDAILVDSGKDPVCA